MNTSSEASEGAFGEFFEYSGLCDKGEAREVWEASQNSFKQRVIELLEEHWGKSIDRINFLHEIENLWNIINNRACIKYMHQSLSRNMLLCVTNTAVRLLSMALVYILYNLMMV